jgi:hypothetical protein
MASPLPKINIVVQDALKQTPQHRLESISTLLENAAVRK